MTYSECVSEDEYYICPSEFGDSSKTSCCIDSYGVGQCCVPETIGATNDQPWAGYQTDTPMIYYMDYLLIFGASAVLLVIMGLLCCEYSDFTLEQDNSYLIKQHSVAPNTRFSEPHDYNGNNFRVLREYNRHIDNVPSAPPSYYEEFDNGTFGRNYERHHYPEQLTENTNTFKKSNQHCHTDTKMQYQLESTSCHNWYLPPSNAPRRSPSFNDWS